MNAWRSRGFTLLEMMAAVAVLGIVVAVVAPSFANLIERRQVIAAAQSFASALRTAQVEAIARNRSTEVIFTSSNPVSAYAASAAATNAEDSTAWMIRERNSQGPEGFVAGRTLASVSSQIAVASPLNTIGFTPLGRPVDFAGGTRLPLAEPLIVRFTVVGGRRFCTYLEVGGAIGVCDPARPDGDQQACRPRLPAGAC